MPRITISASRSLRAAWHKELLTGNLAQRLQDGSLLEFPAALLQLTKLYLERKKLHANSEACDVHLDGLVREHVQREHGSLDVAILACALEYSPFRAVASLISIRGDNLPNPSFTQYLRCLMIAHTIAPMYVTENEAQAAKALLHIRLGYPDPLSIFHSMIETLADIPSSQVLPSWYINRLLVFCRIPQSYEMYLTMLQRRFQLATLYSCVSWLHEYMPPRQCQLALEVLQGQVPQLRQWASWKPNEERLQQWEEYQFTAAQLNKLAPLLRLEGPDTTNMGKPAYKEALPACLRTVNIQAVVSDNMDEDERNAATSELIERVLRLLCDALRLGPSATNLFIHMCVERSATASSVTFVENVIQTSNDDCCQAALALAATETPGTGVIARMVALTDALPVLHAYETLRSCGSRNIAEDVANTMEAAQKEYQTQIYAKVSDNLAHKIHAFAKAISEVGAWLHNDLPPALIESICRFPKDGVFEDIMSHLQFSLMPASETTMRSYLLATLGGTVEEDGSLAALEAAVDAERELWLSHPDVERNRILETIRCLPYIQDVQFLRACRQRIIVEDIVLLQDLQPLLERDSHASCVEILRILGRRLELPMPVDDVWVSLVSLMLLQRADAGILSWACDNLSAKAWFRWQADVRVVFSGRDQADRDMLADKLGLTAERQQWWLQLQDQYLTAVEYLERLQRRQVPKIQESDDDTNNRGGSSGGLAPMKWLYLKETPNVEALLQVVAGRSSVDVDSRWIISFFEPTPSVLETLCNYLAAHATCSEQGKYGLRTILERFFTASLPDSATSAYMMAFQRSLGLTEADKAALSMLSELMRIEPSMNPHGLAVIKSRMLQRYDKVIELARDVEAIRIRLNRHNTARTDTLASRLGMVGMRPYIDTAIPEHLTDAIEGVGDSEYELSFPLAHLRGTDRKARGIGSDAFQLLTVRVRIKDSKLNYRFCLHLEDAAAGGSDSDGEKTKHNYWAPNQLGRRPVNRICTTNFNLFTHALAQRLHHHFQEVTVATLSSVHEVVSKMIQQPAAYCMGCSRAMPDSLWKPTICFRSSCTLEMAKSNLLVRAYGLLVDTEVLDLLLSFVYAAAKDTSSLPLLSTDCPFDKAQLTNVINSFPALQQDDSATPYSVLQKIRTYDGNSVLSQDREKLLAWMSKWFRGCLLSAPPGKRLPIMAGVKQFLLFNATPESETAFNESVRRRSLSNRAGGNNGTGEVVFHGSQAARMWKVLTEGLRNMSNTKYMAHGAVNGPGIYLADEPSTSYQYSGALTETWTRSAYRGKKVLLGCELLEPQRTTTPAGRKTPPAGTHIVTDESRVLVRYVFVTPPTYSVPLARQINTAMRSTFAALRQGPSPP